MRINQYAKFLGVFIPGIAGIATTAASGAPITHGTTPYEIGAWVVAFVGVYVLPNARSLAEQASQVFTEVHHHHYRDAVTSGVNAIGADITDAEAAVGTPGKHTAAVDPFEDGLAVGRQLFADLHGHPAGE